MYHDNVSHTFIGINYITDFISLSIDIYQASYRFLVGFRDCTFNIDPKREFSSHLAKQVQNMNTPTPLDHHYIALSIYIDSR